jgi:hypothetical protein
MCIGSNSSEYLKMGLVKKREMGLVYLNSSRGLSRPMRKKNVSRMRRYFKTSIGNTTIDIFDFHGHGKKRCKK